MVKNSLIYLNGTRVLAYLAVIVLLFGFLFNRPLNNVGLLLAGLHTVLFLPQSWKETKSWFLYSLIVLILFPTIYDLLCGDWEFFHQRYTMKWSLIVYPLFFAGCKRYSGFFRHTMYITTGVFLFASLYSLGNYVADFEQVTALYGQAKVMKVLAYSDHIRLSWATVLSMILAVYLLLSEKNRQARSFLVFYLVFQFLYLHVLGSKTGLISLYLSAMVLITGLTWKNYRRWALVGLAVIFLSPVVAYYTIPSFYNRVNFIKYDFSFYSAKEYRPGLSDAIRVYSIQGGWDLFRQNIWTGTGFSGIKEKMNAWYRLNKPELDPSSYFRPISQVLSYAAAGGITGLLVILFFSISIMIKSRQNLYLLAYAIPLIVSFLYETHLENQTGVFVFGFFLGLLLHVKNTRVDEIAA